MMDIITALRETGCTKSEAEKFAKMGSTVFENFDELLNSMDCDNPDTEIIEEITDAWNEKQDEIQKYYSYEFYPELIALHEGNEIRIVQMIL